MTRSLGRCYPDRRLIRIANFVRQESDVLLQEVLCHEAAHVAAYYLHGKSIRPHGREWKALMLEAGYPTSARYKGSALSKLPQKTTRRRSAQSILDILRTEILSQLRSLALPKNSS